jgi:hypothetical protein
MGEVVGHSSNIPDPVAVSSAESEYNEACLACQTTTHLHMAVNQLEQVETRGKDEKSVENLLENKSSATFKHIQHSMYIIRHYHYIRAGIAATWHFLTCMSNIAQVTDSGLWRGFILQVLSFDEKYTLLSVRNRARYLIKS